MKEIDVQMPISLRMKNATNDLVNNVNDISKKYQLPAYLLDKMITDLHIELQNQIFQEEKLYRDKIENIESLSE